LHIIRDITDEPNYKVEAMLKPKWEMDANDISDLGWKVRAGSMETNNAKDKIE